MPAQEVIASATSVAAEVLGMTDRLGTIAPGAYADLIVVDGNPLEDLGVLGGQGERIPAIMQGGRFVPIPFDTMIDPETGRTRVRSVDITSTRYAIARRYMLRLSREDFDDPQDVAKLASIAHLSSEEFRDRFGYLTHVGPAVAVDGSGKRG